MTNIKKKETVLAPNANRIVLIVNETCFFKCKMCSFWKNKNSDNLDLTIWNKFINNLTNITNKYSQITFTGGEPLSSKNIFDVLTLANNNSFNTNLNTNGWLINSSTVKKLFDSNINQITFSVDGSCSNIHDTIRGMPGSFKKIISDSEKIKKYFNSREKDILINFTCVISGLNIENVVDLAILVQNNKFIDAIWFQCITAPFSEPDIINGKVKTKRGLKDWYKHENYKHLWPDKLNKVLRVYSKLISLKKQNKSKIAQSIDHLKMQCNYFNNPDSRIANTKCNVINDLIINMISGEVLNCIQYKEFYRGNILKQSISEIWNSKRSKILRDKMYKCQLPCHEVINCNKNVQV